jgi:hypothetical protein
MKYDTRFITTELMLDGIAFCVSGFVTGVLVSSFSTNREMETTILASVLTTVWFVIEHGSIPFRVGLTGSDLACRLLNVAVSAICLLAFAIIGAWLIRKLRLRGWK